MQLHVQLACAVRCSATGNSLCDAALNVLVDGERKRYLRRNDGFLLFMDLSNGKHCLTLRHPYYRDAQCSFMIEEGETTIEVVTMRPMYVAGENLCRLTVTGMKPGTTAYISGQTYPLQLQQSECPAGTQNLRLFKRGAFKLVPPLRMLCADESAPETCILMDIMSEDNWRLASPLRCEHKRGVKFYPTQPYEAQNDGTTQAVFFAAGPISMLYENKLYELTVKEGEQTWQIPL